MLSFGDVERPQKDVKCFTSNIPSKMFYAKKAEFPQNKYACLKHYNFS